MLTIKNGKIYINGTESTNPELIGLALLDLLDEHPNLTLNNKL